MKRKKITYKAGIHTRTLMFGHYRSTSALNDISQQFRMILEICGHGWARAGEQEGKGRRGGVGL